MASSCKSFLRLGLDHRYVALTVSLDPVCCQHTRESCNVALSKPEDNSNKTGLTDLCLLAEVAHRLLLLWLHPLLSEWCL